MTTKEDFRQAIRRGNISEAFLVAMSNAPELNITTKIVTADGQKVDAGEQLDNCLHTHINLIEGKVENEIGEQLTGDRYAEIKQFHLQQVTQGHQTIQQNLISLQKMFQLMSAFEQQQTASHSNWVDIAADVERSPLSSSDNRNQLQGNIHNALAAGKTEAGEENTVTSINEANAEPQLPSFDAEDDEMVNDLLSLVDLDDDTDAAEAEPETNAKQADWSDWLDDEPDVKSEVFDLKSLNINEAKENWHNWEEQNEAIAENIDSDLNPENPES